MNQKRQYVKTRHIILAVMCVMYFISYIDRVNIAVAGPLIRDEMGLTSMQLGLVFSAFAYPLCGDADHRRMARGQVRTEARAHRAIADLGRGHACDGFCGQHHGARVVAVGVGYRRRRRVSDRDTRVHVLDAGARTRLCTGHYAQFRAARRRGHAAARAGGGRGRWLARAIHSARRREPCVDGVVSVRLHEFTR